jgi:hypothetical protein
MENEDDKKNPQPPSLLEQLEALGHVSDTPTGEGVSREGDVSQNLAALGHTPDATQPSARDISAAEQAKLVASGAVAQGTPLAAGLQGFRMGFAGGAPLAAAAAPVLGPAASAIPFVTGAGAAVAGYYGTKALANSLIDEPEPTDIAAHALYESGGTLGEAIAFAPLAFYIPTTLAPAFGRIGQYLVRTGEGARKYKKSYLFGETSSGGMSSLGTYRAETQYPGEAGKRFMYEVGFGLLDPTKLVPLVTSKGVDVLKTAISLRNREGREAFKQSRSIASQDKAATRLIEIFEQYGEDVPALIKALEEPLPGAPTVSYPPAGGLAAVTGPTAAQKTGSLTVTQLEAALSSLNPKFAADVNEQGRQSLLAYSLVLNKLTDIGSPDALKAAALMRQSFFNSALDARLNTAVRRGWETVQRTFKGVEDSPAVRAEVGQIIRNEVELALKNARTAEKILWTNAQKEALTPKGKVQRGARAFEVPNTLLPGNMIQAYLKRVSEIAPEFRNELVPAPIQNFMKSLGVTPEVIDRYRKGMEKGAFVIKSRVDKRYQPDAEVLNDRPVLDLIELRSTFLDLVRNSAAKGDPSHASFYTDMQRALLKDLSTLPGQAYDVARSFSRDLNDKFTRTFANDLLEKTGTGADAIPPEMLVTNAFGAGTDRVALRMRQIEGAVGFMKDRLSQEVLDGVTDPEVQKKLKDFATVSTDGVVSVQDAQSRVLRLLASKALYQDPKELGRVRVNRTQLDKFIKENKPLLDEMGLTQDLMDASTAENLLASAIKTNSALNTRIRNQTAFSKVLDSSPTIAVGNALSQTTKDPARAIRQLVLLAKKGGPEAIEGLKSSIYDYIATKASDSTAKIDPQKYYDAFFKGRYKDQVPLVNILKGMGVMSPEEVNNLRAATNQMFKIEDVLTNRRMLEDVIQGADIMGELVMRVVGSKIGTAATSGGPGSLIAASAGSKAIRQIFDQMPTLAARNLMEEGLRNPQLMAQLLRRGKSQREKLIYARRLHSYLMAAGYNYLPSTFPTDAQLQAEEEAERKATREAYKNLRDMPPPNPAFSTPNSSQERLRRAFPPAPPARGMPGMGGGGGGQPPGGGGAPPTSQSRMMLQQLFPNDAITGAAAAQGAAPPMPG